MQYTEDEFLQTLDWKPFGNEDNAGSAKQLVVNPSGWDETPDFGFPGFGFWIGFVSLLDSWSIVAFEITDIDIPLFARPSEFWLFLSPIWKAVKRKK